MKKININYNKISNGWTIEYFLKEHGFKKTAEALWVQCYYNEEKDVEVNTFFEERKPETPETEWKAEVLEAIGEQPTEEQPTEEQTADNQTTEQAEDTAEQQEEQASKPTGKPKTYREIIDMIIKASSEESEVSELCREIDFAYQHDKIKPRENKQLYALINKIF